MISLGTVELYKTKVANLAEFKASVIETNYNNYSPECIFESEKTFSCDNLGYKSLFYNNLILFKLFFNFGLSNKKIIFLSSDTKIVKMCDILNLYLSNLKISSKYAKKNISHLKKNRLRKRTRKILPRKTTCAVSISSKKNKFDKMSRLNKGIYNVDVIPKSLDRDINYVSSLFISKYLTFFYKLGLDFFLKKKLNKTAYNLIIY